MEQILPQTYLVVLIGLLAIIALLVGRQLIKVRKDEIKLISLEKEGASNSKEAAELYELASVQIRKRLYPQAIASLQKALNQLSNEPDEAKAVIENALGFCLAAQNDFKGAVIHYKTAIRAKPNYPIALNNLAFAKKELKEYKESLKVYKKTLEIEPTNKTALKQIKLLKNKNIKESENSLNGNGF